MNETLRNSVSALIDHEASEFETRKVVDVSKTEREILGYWAAAHSIGSSMRGEGLLGGSLLDRVNYELDGQLFTTSSSDSTAESVVPQDIDLKSEGESTKRLGIFIEQLAVAASIALAVLVGVKIVSPTEMGTTVVSNEPLEVIKFQLPVQKETVAVEGAMVADEAVGRQPTVRILSEQDIKGMVSNRLSPYLVRHAENSAVIGGTSVLPLARIMGRDTPIE